MDDRRSGWSFSRRKIRKPGPHYRVDFTPPKSVILLCSHGYTDLIVMNRPLGYCRDADSATNVTTRK